MKGCVWAVVLFGGFAGAWAMPTETETREAEGLVQNLMKNEQIALGSGRKTRAEVAQSALALAEAHDSEAVKLLLMKGAFDLLVRAGEFDKAKDALLHLCGVMPDIPDENIAHIIEHALRSAPRTNGDPLAGLLDDAKARARFCRQRTSQEVLAIEIAPGRKMPFVKCPAGTFNMGDPNAGKRAKDPCDVKFYHEVTITRPFWMSKYPVTVGDYEAVMGRKLPLTKAQKTIGPDMPLIVLGESIPHDFFRRVAQQAARQLPKGTVLRLPTEAELYYVWQEGKDFSFSSPYLSTGYYYSWGDIKELLASKGVPIPKSQNPSKKTPEDACFGPEGISRAECVYGPVGQRQPTDWGLCDFHVRNGIMVLDRVRKIGVDEPKRSPRLAKDVDPLCMDGPDAMCVMLAFGFSGFHWFGTVRLVIGPDLITEKGYEVQGAGCSVLGWGASPSTEYRFPGLWAWSFTIFE